MAKGGNGGQMNALSGGAPAAPPGVVASGGGGPPPLPGAVSPYGPQSGAANPMDPSSPGYAQRMAAAENFQRQALRGNRESRALSPGQIRQRMLSIQQGGDSGGGGGYIPPQVTEKITPGGGNQKAFSPQAAKVETVTTPGRWALANLMAGASNPNRTVFRGGGYDRGR